MLVEKGESEDKNSTKKALLYKAFPDGKIFKENKLDTSKNGLNIHDMSTSCLLCYNENRLALHIARGMTVSSDGLNHQGAIFVTLDPENLDIASNYGQTSGHSWGNSLRPTKGGFYGMDLGDNYPRGIHMWTFSRSSIYKYLIYSMKTSHGETPSNSVKSFSKYSEISTSEKAFYRWSNDNKTYTELAAPGIEELEGGDMIIFFVGEAPALDNSKAGKYVNVARNIGFIRVNSSIQIISKGKVEKGGFYDFGGGWNSQENRGVVWITNKTELTDNVSRLKTARIMYETNFLLFEIWSENKYSHTAFMICDDNGNIIKRETKLEFPLRLHKADDIVFFDGRILIFSGMKEKKLAVFTIYLD